MLATVLQVFGLTLANAGAYLYDPTAGFVATGLTFVYVGLAAERG
jgi:hypothetical protein